MIASVLMTANTNAAILNPLTKPCIAVAVTFEGAIPSRKEEKME